MQQSTQGVYKGAEQQKRPYTKKVLNQSTNSNTDIEVWSETSLPKSIKSTQIVFLKLESFVSHWQIL